MADEIDLLNVSFDGQSAPDRISAKAGVSELRRIAPLRKYLFKNFTFKIPSLSSFDVLRQQILRSLLHAYA